MNDRKLYKNERQRFIDVAVEGGPALDRRRCADDWDFARLRRGVAFRVHLGRRPASHAKSRDRRKRGTYQCVDHRGRDLLSPNDYEFLDSACNLGTEPRAVSHGQCAGPCRMRDFVLACSR